MSDLERVLRKVAETTHNIAYEDANEGCTQDLKDAAELVRVLARLMAGKNVHDAFGAPGDWGYETPIGQALYAHYSTVGGGREILTNRT